MAAPTAQPSVRATFIARWLLAIVATLAVSAGLGLIARATSQHSALAEAAAVADAAAHIWVTEKDPAQASKSLTELANNHPAVATAFAIAEGGIDEFGIARGTELTYGNVKDADKKALIDHAKTVTADAARALKADKPMTIEQLRTDLGDGSVAVAVAFRAAPKSQQPAGVAGAVLKPTPQWPVLHWSLALLLAAIVAALSLWLPRRLHARWFDGATALLSALAWWLLQPALPVASGGGITVVGADLLVPHLAPAAAVPLTLTTLAVLVGLLVVLAAAVAGPLAVVFDGMRRDVVPYFYVGPALIATGLLIFIPFAVGVGLSFVDKHNNFVGLQHYIEVISSITDPSSSTHFGRTLAMTVLWTVLNVGAHVTIGLGLALVLNRPHLRGRALYRLLLIVPWAVPSYITALTWKWLFNTQVGPLNAMLVAMGQDRIDWLGTSAVTNFAANFATNVWLGFPFMMVISLGALQSISNELYEAADMDGGSAWQKFRYITLPLLRPALFPAIILGTIWTFNAFNVIWLVSGGGPDHKTDILITEAYYTFTVLRQTGLAAAYSVLIFLILLGYTLVTNRLTKATEAVNV